MPTQNVNITDELESFVKTQITGGHFNNVSEVHRAALSLMARREEERALRIESLRQEIQAGLDDVKAGRYAEYDSAEALFESIVK
jgi:antitoxin ParD1/3/4